MEVCCVRHVNEECRLNGRMQTVEQSARSKAQQGRAQTALSQRTQAAVEKLGMLL